MWWMKNCVFPRFYSFVNCGGNVWEAHLNGWSLIENIAGTSSLKDFGEPQVPFRPPWVTEMTATNWTRSIQPLNLVPPSQWCHSSDTLKKRPSPPSLSLPCFGADRRVSKGTAEKLARQCQGKQSYHLHGFLLWVMMVLIKGKSVKCVLLKI